VAGDDDAVQVNLALQGGGSHGAFTWGVLDALLEDGSLSFDGVTGASAGAMNAVVMADGWLDGLHANRDPRETARAALADFWEAVGCQPNAFSLGPAGTFVNPHATLWNPLLVWSDLVSRLLSPYQLNPLNWNPLRGIIEQRVDFARLNAQAPFTSARPTCAAGGRASSASTSSRCRCCWRRPACRSRSRPSRCRTRPTGTAATWATRRCSRCSTRRRPPT
jgi:predicted acylesterase/phospholipase RssA